MHHRLLFLAFCLLLSRSIGAATQVRSNSTTSPTVYASNSSSSFLTMVVEVPGSGTGSGSGTGVGSDESAPYKAYIPLGSAATQQTCTSVSDGTLLPEPRPSVNNFIKISLNLTNDSGSAQTIYAAVKDGSSYEAFALSTTFSANSSVGTVTMDSITFSLENLCTSNASASCSTISTSTTAGLREGEFLVYFFLATSAPPLGDPVTTTENGVFYSLKVSDKMPSGDYELLTLHKGDTRLVAEVQNGDQITQMGTNLYRSMLFLYSGADTPGECPGVAVNEGRGAVYSLETAVLNGLLTIKGLTNETNYTFAVALVNKYQFTTVLNNTKSETPQTIEALLRENACFLLTVGFEGGHPTIEYFRRFRDQVLLGDFWGGHLGKLAVILYYHYGPNLAHKIIAMDSRSSLDLKQFIRTSAIWLHAFMKHLF